MTKLIDLLSVLNTGSQREKKRSWMALFSKITPPLRWRCTPELEVEMGTVAIVLFLDPAAGSVGILGVISY